MSSTPDLSSVAIMAIMAIIPPYNVVDLIQFRCITDDSQVFRGSYKPV